MASNSLLLLCSGVRPECSRLPACAHFRAVSVQQPADGARKHAAPSAPFHAVSTSSATGCPDHCLSLSQVLTKSASPHMLDLFGQVWDQLPLCAIVDEKAFVVHGGLFRMHGVAIADLEAAPRTECSLLCSPATDPAMVLLVDALWNDPQDALGISQGDRGEGTRMFGPDVTEDFLKRNGLELVIRSHQVFRICHLVDFSTPGTVGEALLQPAMLHCRSCEPQHPACRPSGVVA